VKKKKRYHCDHQQATSIKKEIIWQNMENISLKTMVIEWVSYMSPITRKNYLSGMNRLSALRIVDLNYSLQEISLLNHETVFDRISNVQLWSECSKQSRAALYISLTRFLSRKTDGIIKKATPRTGEANRTFFRVREKVKTEALKEEEWKKIIKTMELHNHRDALIAKLCLQGARRIHEVLELKIPQINREKSQILFILNKTRGLIKHVMVTVPVSVMQDIVTYIKSRKKGYVFITSKRNRVHYSQVLRSLKKASRTTSIRKKIHTHVLRTSAITHIRSLGFQDFEIQRLTGHSSTQMLNAYDKTSIEDNTSQKVSLI
jgi:integrase/recombinase XerD